MTVAALGEQMSSTEVVGWSAFFALEEEERAARRKKEPEV